MVPSEGRVLQRGTPASRAPSGYGQRTFRAQVGPSAYDAGRARTASASARRRRASRSSLHFRVRRISRKYSPRFVPFTTLIERYTAVHVLQISWPLLRRLERNREGFPVASSVPRVCPRVSSMRTRHEHAVVGPLLGLDEEVQATCERGCELCPVPGPLEVAVLTGPQLANDPVGEHDLHRSRSRRRAVFGGALFDDLDAVEDVERQGRVLLRSASHTRPVIVIALTRRKLFLIAVPSWPFHATPSDRPTSRSVNETSLAFRCHWPIVQAMRSISSGPSAPIVKVSVVLPTRSVFSSMPLGSPWTVLRSKTPLRARLFSSRPMPDSAGLREPQR